MMITHFRPVTAWATRWPCFASSFLCLMALSLWLPCWAEPILGNNGASFEGLGFLGLGGSGQCKTGGATGQNGFSTIHDENLAYLWTW